MIVINIVSFLLYAIDKLLAKKQMRRVSEKTLLLLAVVGGSVGAWLAMQLFRHKTLHLKFRYGVPVIILLQLAAFYYFSGLRIEAI